jgi:hypothetical protein
MGGYIGLTLEAIAVALVAFVYAEILTAPGMLLNSWYNYVARNAPDFLFKPLAGCIKCVAGQLALWVYMVNYWHSYSIQAHVFYICFAIFITLLLNKIHTWTQ